MIKNNCPFLENGYICTYNRGMSKHIKGRPRCSFKDPAQCPFYTASGSELKKTRIIAQKPLKQPIVVPSGGSEE